VRNYLRGKSRSTVSLTWCVQREKSPQLPLRTSSSLSAFSRIGGCATGGPAHDQFDGFNPPGSAGVLYWWDGAGERDFPGNVRLFLASLEPDDSPWQGHEMRIYLISVLFFTSLPPIPPPVGRGEPVFPPRRAVRSAPFIQGVLPAA